MATITLSVPDDIRAKMKRHDKTNWSAIARDAVIAQIGELERKEKLRELLVKEENDMSWTIELGNKLKRMRPA